MKSKSRSSAIGECLGLVAVLAVLIAFFAFKTGGSFWSTDTFSAIASQVPAAIIIAVGMTFVLVIGGIDLSVGSVAGLCGSVLGFAMVNWKWPLPAGIMVCIAAGIAAGSLNGLVCTKWKVPSFIVTLGMLEAARGATYLLSGSRTIYIGERIEPIANTAVLGLPLPFIVALLVVVAGQIVLTRAKFGRYALAIGANEQAVRLSGIEPSRIKAVVFALCGTLVSIAALIDTSRLASADPNAGNGFELQAIAAVVIGGTSLTGGRGSAVNSLLGVLVIAVLGAGLTQMGAQEPTKRLITGCVIVLAVVLDSYRRRRRGAETT